MHGASRFTNRLLETIDRYATAHTTGRRTSPTYADRAAKRSFPVCLSITRTACHDAHLTVRYSISSYFLESEALLTGNVKYVSE